MRMAIQRRSLPGLLAILCLAWTVCAQDEAAVQPSADSFDSYKLLLDRNIFNPDRRAPRPGQTREEEPRPVATPVPEVYIDLVGIWLDEGRRVAFFDGTDGMRGVKNLDDSIADLRVAQLTTTGTLLVTSGTQYALNVGQRLTRRGESPWSMQDAPRTTRPATFSPNQSRDRGGRNDDRDRGRGRNNGSDPPGAGPVTVSEEDRAAIMQRLMERRRQEMNQ